MQIVSVGLETNNLPSDVDAAGSQTTLWVAKL